MQRKVFKLEFIPSQTITPGGSQNQDIYRFRGVPMDFH